MSQELSEHSHMRYKATIDGLWRKYNDSSDVGKSSIIHNIIRQSKFFVINENKEKVQLSYDVAFRKIKCAFSRKIRRNARQLPQIPDVSNLVDANVNVLNETTIPMEEGTAQAGDSSDARCMETCTQENSNAMMLDSAVCERVAVDPPCCEELDDDDDDDDDDGSDFPSKEVVRSDAFDLETCAQEKSNAMMLNSAACERAVVDPPCSEELDDDDCSENSSKGAVHSDASDLETLRQEKSKTILSDSESCERVAVDPPTREEMGDDDHISGRADEYPPPKDDDPSERVDEGSCSKGMDDDLPDDGVDDNPPSEMMGDDVSHDGEMDDVCERGANAEASNEEIYEPPEGESSKKVDDDASRIDMGEVSDDEEVVCRQSSVGEKDDDDEIIVLSADNGPSGDDPSFRIMEYFTRLRQKC